MGYFLTPVYVALSSISLGMAVILYVSHSIDRRSTYAPYGRFDLLLFSLLVYCIAVEGDAIISTLGADDATFTFSYFILCIFAYTLTLTYTLHASEMICRNSARRKIADRSFIALYMVFMVLFLILAPGGLFFTFKDGVIHKERFFYLGVFYIYFSTFLCFLLSCCCRAPGRVKRAYLFYFLIMVFSYVLEEKLVTGSIISCAATLSVTVIYINVYSAHYRSKLEIERELTEERMRMLLWQMQPHFIYNSLSCIQQLCKKSPADAEKALDEFSEYLRGDIDSLSSNALVPLHKELEFTMHFVNLEKYRFSDRLNVEFEIDDGDYLIPPLTIQPLVENAIHYGLCPKIEGGTVKIKTFEKDGKHVITVSDDGVGFDPSCAPDDGRSHVGLGNVRHRLENMCAGELEIKSSPGQGAEVTIILPEV